MPVAMSRPAPERSLRDVVLAVLGALVATLSLTAALRSTPPPARAGAEAVAHVQLATGAVQVRPAETLGWQTAARGDDIHESDAVYVPPGSAARVAFLDGTVLELEERSLVVIEPQRGVGRSITLRQGSIAGVSGSVPLTVATSAGTATLPPNAEASV